MPGDTRERMIGSAIASLRRRGLGGTSFSDVLEESGAARGAIYHHFPDGKSGMVQEAVERFGNAVAQVLEGLDGDSPRDVASAFLAAVRPVVLESVAGAGCPVAAVTTETGSGDRLFVTAAGVFAGWTEVLAARLELADASPAEARRLAEVLIVTLEGSHVLCRALGTIAPFDAAAACVVQAAAARAPRNTAT